jgi:lipoyl(octanoyl) transferase
VASPGRTFEARWLGRVRYGEALALQERLLEQRVAGAIGDTLLLLEHEPVVTLGRGAHEENVVVPRGQLAKLGVEVFETARGGDVTYHGPGQLVAYPIFDLNPDRCDVRRYVRDLARVMIDLARGLGIEAAFLEGDPKLVGVWVDETSPSAWPGDPREAPAAEAKRDARLAKIGAIGVRISRWVTMHGLAFNVSTDLAGFRLIVPCGIAQYGVTSVASLAAASGEGAGHEASGIRSIAEPPSVEAVARSIVPCFERVFEAKGTWSSAST